jgi:asparagine N-glycosylation enzyme membrane subunit Stt3
VYKILIALIILSGCLTQDESPDEIDVFRYDGIEDKPSSLLECETPPKEVITNIVGSEERGDFGKIKNLTLISKEIKIPGDEIVLMDMDTERKYLIYNATQATYVWKGEKYRTGSLTRADTDNESKIPLYPPGDPYKRAFDWIRGNTPEDAVFISWWDYGDMIRVFAQREALISDPCKSIKCLYTLSDDEIDVFRYENDEEFLDVQKFFTTNEDEAYNITRKYGVDYVFVTREEFGKSWAIECIAGAEPSLRIFEVPRTGDMEVDIKKIRNEMVKYRVTAYYIITSEESYTVWYLIENPPIPKIKKSMFLSLLPLEILPDNIYTRDMLNNFELVYSDEEEYIYIYKVI